MAARGLAAYSKDYSTRDKLLEAIEEQKAFETVSVAKQMRWYPTLFAICAASDSPLACFFQVCSPGR